MTRRHHLTPWGRPPRRVGPRGWRLALLAAWWVAEGLLDLFAGVEPWACPESGDR